MQPELGTGLGDDVYATPGERISQGDIFRSLFVYRADSSPIPARHDPQRERAWLETSDPTEFFILRGGSLPAMVVSHDCAIDKQINASGMELEALTARELARRSSKTDVLIAPIRQIPQSWDDEKFLQVARGEILHQFALPPHEEAGWQGGYVDLRWLITYRLSDLLGAQRILCLNEEQVNRLQVALEKFFSWRDQPPGGGEPGSATEVTVPADQPTP